MEVTQLEDLDDVPLWESTADSKDRDRVSSSSSGGGFKGVSYDSKGMSAADSKHISSVADSKDMKEKGGYTEAPSSSSITSSQSNSNSANVNIAGGNNRNEEMRVDNYYSESDSEEEVRDEQGRILHSYLSKEELVAMQEALAEESIIKLDTKQLLDLKEAFDIFDKDNSGSIDSSELEHLMRVFRKEITSEEVTKMMQSCKQSESGEISFQEFVPMMVPVFKLNDRDGAILDAFNVFDIDKSGFLSAKNLQQIMMGLGDSDITEADVDDMINIVDHEGNGQITFSEFKTHILKDPNSVMGDMFEVKHNVSFSKRVAGVGGTLARTGNSLRRGSVMIGDSLASFANAKR